MTLDQRHEAAQPSRFRSANQYGLPCSCFGAVNPLRQTALIQTQAKIITGGRGQICDPLVQIKNESGRHQGSERDGRVATFSRHSVSRLTKRRAAMSLVAMPRLRRASARSRPNLRSARSAGSGMDATGCDMIIVSAISVIMSMAVRYARHC